MNERYKTLWYQAAETTIDDSWEQQTKFMERYTKLVIQECMSNLHLHGYDDAMNQLKQHFGVEQ